MKRMTRSRLRGLLLATCASILLVTAIQAEPTFHGSDPAAPSFELGGDAPVLVYERIATEFADGTHGTAISVWADGRVEVQIPAFMKRAGTWTGQVDPAEVRSLVADLVASGLVESDVAALKARRAEVEQKRAAAAEKAGQSRELFWVSDADVSRLHLSFARYKKAGDLATSGAPLSAAWSWTALHQDAERFAEIGELAAFDRAEHRLLDWMVGDHLKRVEVSR